MSVPEVIVHRDAQHLAKAVAARLVTRLVPRIVAGCRPPAELEPPLRAACSCSAAMMPR